MQQKIVAVAHPQIVAPRKLRMRQPTWLVNAQAGAGFQVSAMPRARTRPAYSRYAFQRRFERILEHLAVNPGAAGVSRHFAFKRRFSGDRVAPWNLAR